VVYHSVQIFSQERFAAWERLLTFAAKPRLKCLVANFKRVPEKAKGVFTAAILMSDSFFHSFYFDGACK